MASALPADEIIPVALLLPGTHGDVAPILGLFSHLPRFKPTVFTHGEHAALVQKRGFEFVSICSLKSFDQTHPQIWGLSGLEFSRNWVAHILSETMLKSIVHSMRAAHSKKKFCAVFVQASGTYSELLAMGDKVCIPLINMEVCEAVPNLRSNPFINTSMIPSFLMPLFWRLYMCATFKLLYDLGWATYCERYGWRIESSAEMWQRYVKGPFLIGNDFAYANRSDFEAIVHDVMVTPRWEVEETINPLVEEQISTFLEIHSDNVGLVCFGSMLIPCDAVAKLSDFLYKCGPVIVQKGTCALPSTASWCEIVAGKVNVLFLDSQVSHTWLLPKVKWFVCHGGVGTMQAALRARVPTMIVPFISDQCANLSNLVGCGPALCGHSKPSLDSSYPPILYCC